jgi:hypothetical protein
MLETLLVLNALWFASAFHVFHVRRKIFAKIIVPKEHRDTPVFETLIATGPFLGGFNLAFSVLNMLLLVYLAEFDKDIQWTIVLFVNAVAHGSQFAGNAPIALQNLKGAGVYEVLKGLMLFIFVIDFTLMLFNGVLALTYLP